MSKRIFHPTKADADNVQSVRIVIKQSRELLEQARPDSFLGRKTQAPFPKEGQEPRGEPQPISPRTER